MVNLQKTSNSKRKGRHVLLPYNEVKRRFGAALAAGILQEKKSQEASKPKNCGTIFWMEHPDARGQEDPHLFFGKLLGITLQMFVFDLVVPLLYIYYHIYIIISI